MPRENEIAAARVKDLLVETPVTLEQQLRTLLTVVSDALRRARDGVPETVRYESDLDYTANQIERARAHLRAAARNIAVWRANLPTLDGQLVKPE